MIKLNNLNKYFFQNKENEIHVLNNINLTLPDKGLVVLLGPSGSGKTTLLNVLGGLDKIKSGSIQYDQQEIKRYDSATWDKIRNKQVGYIFQNYNLLTNLTVYDNIALTLNMINIYDKEEIDKRVDYILDSMGMINYRKRRASQLSGGQQQRVAIARALAKNPKVIIADEPTGNLDSKNTQDIMNIIKRISQNKLVVLVTHEENIASFYGDRIIRLQDGKIVSDDENRSNGTLDVQHETDIYLGDLREVANQSTAMSKFQVYSDEDIEDDLDVRLIIKNKTIYVDVKSKEYQKKQLIESDSEINIYEGNYEHLQRDELGGSDFNLQSIITERNDDTDRHSVISIKDSLKLAVSRLRGASRLGKLFYVGFAGGAVLIAIAVGMLSGILNMDPSKFLEGAENTVLFDKNEQTFDEVEALIVHSSVDYAQYIDSIALNAQLPPLFQDYESTSTLSGTLVYAEYLDNSKIITGRGINNLNEFVIDQDLADQLLSNSRYANLGISSYSDLMKIDYTIEIMGSEGTIELTNKLVGIVDDTSTVIYAHKELAYMQSFGVGLYEYYQNDITLVDGELIDSDFEMLIYDVDYLLPVLSDNVQTIEEQEFTASGTFTSDNPNIPMMLVKTSHLEEAYFNNTYKQKNSDISFYANDKEAFISYLKTKNIIGIDSFESQLEEYQSNRFSDSLGTIIFTAVVLGASAVSYFFILRSSLLSRIYEVSVYRALGVTKGDIRKMFITEIILITSITSMVGYLATSFIMWRIQILAADYMDIIHISPLSIVSGIIIIFFVNIVAGLIPVTNLLTKTPAEILSKYDF